MCNIINRLSRISRQIPAFLWTLLKSVISADDIRLDKVQCFKTDMWHSIDRNLKAFFVGYLSTLLFLVNSFLFTLFNSISSTEVNETATTATVGSGTITWLILDEWKHGTSNANNQKNKIGANKKEKK